MRINFSSTEQPIVKRLQVLKRQAGSHSPGLFTFRQKMPEIDIKVDACFLSNPYATDLFLDYFNREIVDRNRIREILECYPSQNSVIAEILAASLKIHQESIFIGNGAIEIIQAVIHNLTKKKIMVNIPTFSSYYEFVKDGVEVVYNVLCKEDDYELHVQKYIDQVKLHKPDTIVLINPNNPNGSYTKMVDIQLILSELSFVDNIIIDESFIHFAYEDQQYGPVSLAHLVASNPNLIVIKSMSKDFGVAGIRAGYGIMDPAHVKTLLNKGYLWNSNGLAEYFFRLYARKDFAIRYEELRIKYIIETLEFIKELQDLPFMKVYPSMANFVLIELTDGIKAADFVAKLLICYGIYIRTCDDKIGLEGQYIRLASRSKEENNYVIESLRSCLEAQTQFQLAHEAIG